MANGGGPACLRLRVVADPATVDPRFLVDEARLDLIAGIVEQHWPAEIHSDELREPRLITSISQAREALLETLSLGELASG
jgi:succinylarginine dihydrolase